MTTRLRRTFQWLTALAVLAIASSHIASPAVAQTALDQIGKSGTIKVGWTSWYPYHFRDPKSKELTGASAKIIEKVAAALRVKIEWVEDSAGTAIAGLQSKKFHMFGTPMAITLDRARAVTYTEPFLRNRVGVAVPTEDLSKYKSWKDTDIASLRACVVLGSNVDAWATRIFQNVQLARMKDIPLCVQDLNTGRSRALLTSYGTFAKIGKKFPNLAVVPGDPWMTGQVGYMVRHGDYKFREWLNYFFVDLKKTGDLLRILESYGLDNTFVQY